MKIFYSTYLEERKQQEDLLPDLDSGELDAPVSCLDKGDLSQVLRLKLEDKVSVHVMMRKSVQISHVHAKNELQVLMG